MDVALIVFMQARSIRLSGHMSLEFTFDIHLSTQFACSIKERFESVTKKDADLQVGDGTTTVVLLAGEFLREAKPFIEDGVHPQLIIRAFRSAVNLMVKKVKDLAVSIEGKSFAEKKTLLEKCAATTLSSKLVGGEKDFFAKMVVDAVTSLGDDSRLNMIGIKKVSTLS